MSVTKRLVLLVLAVLIPALAAAVWGLSRAHQYQREAAEESLRQLSRALASVIDQELANRVVVLQTLAQAPALAKDEMERFYQYARAITPTFERTIVLADREGRQLLNTRLPLGEPLPISGILAKLRQQLEVTDDAIVVSDLYFAPVGKQFSFAVQVPVGSAGRVERYLTMGSFASTLQRFVEDPRLGEGWNASIIDRTGTVVARRLEPERFVGKQATPDFVQRLAGAREGLFETVRLDGTATVTAYTPIGGWGWTLAVSMPRAELQAPFARALAATSLVALALFALAALFAVVMGRSITRPLAALVTSAAAVGRGEPPPPWRHRLAESRLIAAELERAAGQIRAASRDLEARVQAAVAESQRAQEALAQSRRLEALGRLTGGIAHDFNNLLQTISVANEMMLRGARDPALLAAAEAGKRAVDNAVKLTRQLMSFGRAQESSREPLDLRDQALKLQELLSRALRGDIELEFAFPGDLWRVLADPVQLELAVLNAVFNARDAMPAGGRVIIGARNVVLAEGEKPGVRGGDYVRLDVRDDGAGIPADVLPRVFEPFFTTKEVGKGLGLGLAQVYGFATQSGGTAVIDSAEGRGTTLSIWLPRHDGALNGPAAARGEETLDGGGCRVLFVEDDALVRSVVQPALEASGFRVLAAASMGEALELLERERAIDVVFSDIVMPGGSGAALARRLAALRPGLPVLLATGYAAVADAPARVLAKPYRLAELKAALLSAARRK